MENVDEKILKQRVAMEEFEKQRFAKETIEEEIKQSIFDGIIHVNKIPVTFSERTLLQDKIAIWMPEDFEELTPEEIASIYILGNKPELVLGNTYLNLSVGFHYTENVVPNEFMGDFVKIAKVVFNRIGPKVRIISEKVHKVGKHTVSSLECVSHTITDEIYNVMFFSSLEGKVLIGFINFNIKFRERYKAIVDEMLQSFRFIEDEVESEED